jgi:hypothetical protein
MTDEEAAVIDQQARDAYRQKPGPPLTEREASEIRPRLRRVARDALADPDARQS